MTRSFVAWFIAAALGWFGVDVYVEGRADRSARPTSVRPGQVHALDGDGSGLPPVR
jgi:hypothetical protein